MDLQQAIRVAKRDGKADGRNAAEWYLQDSIGGRVERAGVAAATARRIVAGVDDGDPAVLDALPYPPAQAPRDLVIEYLADNPDADDEGEITDAYAESWVGACHDKIYLACKRQLKCA